MFFKQWLFQPVIPKIQAIWTYDAKSNNLKVNLEQIQKGDFVFNMPVEVAYYKKGSQTPILLKMQMDKKQKTQTFMLKEAPERFEVDPRNVLLSEPSIVSRDAIP
jgi:aminopeptidase N